MPPRDASRLQLDFPDLAADIIRELRIQGTVGLLDFNDSVQPVYIVSSRGGALDVTAEPNVFETSEIFSSIDAVIGVNAILVDSGQLPAGTYDVKVVISWAAVNAAALVSGTLDFQHRNAANAANLANVPLAWVCDVGFEFSHTESWTYATVISQNERLRVQNLTAAFTGRIGTTIMAARRPAP